MNNCTCTSEVDDCPAATASLVRYLVRSQPSGVSMRNGSKQSCQLGPYLRRSYIWFCLCTLGPCTQRHFLLALRLFPHTVLYVLYVDWPCASGRFRRCCFLADHVLGMHWPLYSIASKDSFVRPLPVHCGGRPGSHLLRIPRCATVENYRANVRIRRMMLLVMVLYSFMADTYG